MQWVGRQESSAAPEIAWRGGDFTGSQWAGAAGNRPPGRPAALTANKDDHTCQGRPGRLQLLEAGGPHLAPRVLAFFVFSRTGHSGAGSLAHYRSATNRPCANGPSEIHPGQLEPGRCCLYKHFVPCLSFPIPDFSIPGPRARAPVALSQTRPSPLPRKSLAP